MSISIPCDFNLEDAVNIKIRIDTSNAAFEDNENELADILDKAIDHVLDADEHADLRDSNGNSVGSVDVEEDEPSDED